MKKVGVEVAKFSYSQWHSFSTLVNGNLWQFFAISNLASVEKYWKSIHALKSLQLDLHRTSLMRYTTNDDSFVISMIFHDHFNIYFCNTNYVHCFKNKRIE